MKRLLCLLCALLMVFTCGCGSNNECDHDYELVKTVDASCTKDGYKKYKCARCDHSYITELPQTGHSFENGICQLCGELEVPDEQPHTKLTAALVNKIAKGNYTDESYEVYEKAYNAALLMNNKNDATQEQLGNALTALNDAIAGLTIKTNTVTILRKVVIDGVAQSIDDKPIKYSVPVEQSICNIFIPSLDGYKYLRVDGFTFTPTETGDGSGYLTCIVSSDITITMWYENQVDLSRLNNLLADTITSQHFNSELKYTDESWNVYVEALNNAKNFTLMPNTQQKDVLALVKALEEARTKLVIASDEVFINVEKATDTFNEGGNIILLIETSCNIPELVITKAGTKVTPELITAEIQTLTTGETLKMWLVILPADEAGTFIYTINYGSTNNIIEVEII